MTDASSAELEREAESVRARISDTADQLRAKMTPGQLMDEVLGQFRNGDSSRMLDNLRLQARDNPMALALIGSGVAWLLLGSGVQPGDASRTDREGTGSATAAEPLGSNSAAAGWDVSGTSGADAGSLGDRAPDAVARLGEGFGTRLHGAGDRVSELAAGAGSAGRDALAGAGDRVSGLAAGVGSAGRDALAGSGDAAMRLGRQARSTFLDVLESEPLVLGALGLAVGAAIGAMLPASEVEREHLGPAAEALKDEARDLARRGVDAAKQTAGEVYRSARDEADRQGLLPGDEPVLPKVEAVVRTASETAEAQARQLVGDEKDR